MQNFTNAVNKILSPGPAVFMPVIIFIFYLILKLFSNKSVTTMNALKSSIMLGVAFIGMGMVIGFMVSMFEKPFTVIQNALNFKSLDLGWSPMAAISWAWRYAVLMFPVQIIINIIMLSFRWTKVLNADMWNVWNKVFTGIIVQFFLMKAGANEALAVGVALLVGGIQVVFELKNGDVMYERQRQVTKIPNIVTPHSMFLDAPFIYFIDKFLTKFRFFKNKNKSEVKKEIKKRQTFFQKLVNTLRDNMIVGFILGLVIALLTFWIDLENWQTYVQLPFNTAAALVLFPLIAQLFTKSLVPFGMAVQNIMNKRFSHRELYIGLDWPFLAGNPKLWIVATMLIPFELVYAIVFTFIPGVAMVFPLASLVNVCLAPTLLVICNQNMKTMFTAGVLVVPVYLFFGSMTAPAITNIASENLSSMSEKVQDILKGGKFDITNSGYEAPVFRWGWSAGLGFIAGNTGSWYSIVGIILLPTWLISFSLYYYSMKKANKNIRAERLLAEGIKETSEKPPVGAALINRIFKRS